MSLVVGGMIAGLIGSLRPPMNINYAVVGPQGSGKTTLRNSILDELAEVVDAPGSTKKTGMRRRGKLTLPDALKTKSYWIGTDYTHHAEEVSTQIFDLWPRVIFVVLDHLRGPGEKETMAVLSALNLTLASQDYLMTTKSKGTYPWPTSFNIFSRNNWTKKERKSKKRCSNIVLIDNKMDLVRGSPEERGREIDKVLSSYLEPNGPLGYCLRKYSIQAIGGSVKRASHVPYWDLGGRPEPMPVLFTEIIRRIV